MRVCLVGSGGREHALALALARTASVVVTPGSAAMAASVAEFPITTSSSPAEEIEADLYVVGPEAPLVEGLADRLRARGDLVLGPGADGARLEGSKAYMKAFAERAGLPTAAHATFDDANDAVSYLERLSGPFVVKTDGLAAGKGVLVTADLAEAVADVRAKLDGSAFGAAGRRVVIEEFLDGEELSLLVLCDGGRAFALPAARDFKRLGDGDTGPNTGGMGAYSPVELEPGLLEQVMDEIIDPTLAQLASEGIEYRGVLYAGLMLTADGPRLIEYNVRFGDPEAEVVLPMLRGDLAASFAAAAAGRLTAAPEADSGAACGIVLAAGGYPAAPRFGAAISGLEDAEAVEGVRVLHAGTRLEDGRFVVAGGRVLVVTATGPSLALARERAYDAVGEIDFADMTYRRDVALAASLEAARR